MSRPHLLDALRDRVLLCDGGMGSRVQALTLDIERDYWGKENCTDVLTLSRPDLVREIHRGYFAAGADMVETNSFGGSPVTLGEFDLADRAFEINKTGRRTGARGGGKFRRRPRTAGCSAAIGPGTKLPTPGQHRLRPAGGGAGRAVPRADRRRRRCDPDRDLPGPAADQGGGERREDRPRGGRHGHADFCAGYGGNHRHAAGGAGYRRRGDRGACAGCAADRAELRHRPAGNGRASALAVRQNWPGLLSVQPNAGLPELVDGHTALSAGRGRKWRAGWSASSPRTA